MFKFLITLLLSVNVYAASDTRSVQGKLIEGQKSFTNLVKNPACRLNGQSTTAASISFTANTTSSPLDGVSDCTWNPTATAQEISWAVDTMPSGTKGSNCEARLSYRGDASLVSFFVRNSSGPVANGVSLTNSDQAGSVASINYPCSDGTAVPVLRSTGDAASVQYSVYAGEATNLGSVGVNTPFVSYASSAGLSGLGTGSATINYAEWSRVGPNIQLRFRFTKDGSGGSGSTAVAISVPAGITISSRITASYFGGSAGSGVTTNGSFEVYYDTFANNIKFLQNDSTTFVGSEFSANTSVSGFIEFPVQGWESAGTVMNNAQTYYPRYEAVIVADASFSLASDVTQNGSWIASGSRDAQARYTLNFASGVFTTNPICQVTGYRALGNNRYTISAWVSGISSTSVTIEWGYNDDQGASIAAAIANTDDSASMSLVCTSTTPASLPAPILLGSVTSTSTTNAIRHEAAVISCTSSSSVVRQTSSTAFISSVGNIASGACAITFGTAWSAAPICSINRDGSSDPDQLFSVKSVTTTGMSVDCDVSGGVDCTSYAATILCTGLK